MIVSELIAKLSELDPNLTVAVANANHSEDYNIYDGVYGTVTTVAVDRINPAAPLNVFYQPDDPSKATQTIAVIQ